MRYCNDLFRDRHSMKLCVLREAKGIVIYMRILFIGCVESSFILLNELIQNKVNIVGVVTKKKNLFNSDFVDLSLICESEKIDCRYVNNVNDEESLAFIKSKEPDVIYCFGWSELIRKDLIKLAKIGIIGFHPASLPQNRGRHPIIWALALGMKETASTFFFVDEGADSGPIVAQEKIDIDYYDDARSLYDKIMQVAKKQVITFTNQLKNGDIQCTYQDTSNINYWRKRSIKDGEIDWRMSSYCIYNLVRALTHPYVGAHFMYKDKMIKIWRVEEVIDNKFENIEPGKILEVYSRKSFLVKAGDNLVHILQCDEIDLKKGEYLV